MPVIKSVQDVAVVEQVANNSNGDLVETVLVGASTFFGLFVVLLTVCCRRRTCNFDSCPTVKRYIQKTAWCIVCNGLASAALYAYIRSRTLDRPIRCFTPYNNSIFIFLVFGAVSVVGAVRYIAIGLALSDTYEVGGYKIHNPKSSQSGPVPQGFQSAGYQMLLSPYFGYAMVMSAPLFVVALGYVPQRLYNILDDFQVCMPDGEADLVTKIIFCVLLLLFSAWGIVLVEGAYSVRHGDLGDVPCYRKCPHVVNSPFVTGTLASTYSFWLSVAVFVFLVSQSTVSDYLLLLQYLTALDGFWLTLLCFIAAQNNKIMSM